MVIKQDVFEGINPGIKFLDCVEMPVDDQVQQAPQQEGYAVPRQVGFSIPVRCELFGVHVGPVNRDQGPRGDERLDL